MWPITFDQEWPDISRDKSEFTRLVHCVLIALYKLFISKIAGSAGIN